MITTTQSEKAPTTNPMGEYPKVPQDESNNSANPDQEEHILENTKTIPINEPETPQEEQEGVEEAEADDSPDLTTKAAETGQQGSYFIVALIIAIIKDVLEIIIGSIPYVDILTFIVSIPLGLILFWYITQSGRSRQYNNWAFIASTAADAVPILSILPISTLLVLKTFTSKKDAKPEEATISKNGTLSQRQLSDKTTQLLDKMKGSIKNFSSKI